MPSPTILPFRKKHSGADEGASSGGLKESDPLLVASSMVEEVERRVSYHDGGGGGGGDDDDDEHGAKEEETAGEKSSPSSSSLSKVTSKAASATVSAVTKPAQLIGDSVKKTVKKTLSRGDSDEERRAVSFNDDDGTEATESDPLLASSSTVSSDPEEKGSPSFDGDGEEEQGIDGDENYRTLCGKRRALEDWWESSPMKEVEVCATAWIKARAAGIMLLAYILVLQFTTPFGVLGGFAYGFIYAAPIVYLWMRIPDFLGWLLGWILKKFVIYDEQLSFGPIHLHPWVTLEPAEFHIMIKAENFRFGMSDGFELDFLHVREFRTDVHVTVRDLLHVMRMINGTCPWHPNGSAKDNCADVVATDDDAPSKVVKASRVEKGKLPLQAMVARDLKSVFKPVAMVHDSVHNSAVKLSSSLRGSSGKGGSSGDVKPPPDPVDFPHLKPRLGTFRIGHFDVDGAVINFEMGKGGDFIVNAFVRDLALALTKNALGTKAPLPNALKVKVLGARNLQLNKGSKGASVEVSVRREGGELKIPASALDLDETSSSDDVSVIEACKDSDVLVLPLDDPSAVVHVQVKDMSPSATCMIRGTVHKGCIVGQWIMTSYWMAVNPNNCKHTTGTLEHSREGDSCRMKGWFPLMDDKFQNFDGSNGELQLEFEWCRDDAVASTKGTQTALQQLKENSGETTLRLGDVDRVLTMLETFPYKLEVHCSELRDIRFYLGDLFAGKKALKKNRARGIRVHRIEMDRTIFKSKTPDLPGVSLNEFLYCFFIKGTAPGAAKTRAVFGTTLREILYSSFAGGVGRKMAEMPGATVEGIKNAASMMSKAPESVAKNVGSVAKTVKKEAHAASDGMKSAGSKVKAKMSGGQEKNRRARVDDEDPFEEISR